MNIQRQPMAAIMHLDDTSLLYPFILYLNFGFILFVNMTLSNSVSHLYSNLKFSNFNYRLLPFLFRSVLSYPKYRQ